MLDRGQTPDGKTYYYLFDGLGSIIGLTDASGNEVNRYNYEDFGNIHTQQETVQNEWKFAGGYMDDATGFYKFGTRYYMPDLGRWTQQDPMGGSLANFSSYNRYVYANNDPVNATDPSGKISQNCFLALSAAFLGSVGIGQAGFWVNTQVWLVLGSLVGGIDIATAGTAGLLLFSGAAIFGLFLSAALLAVTIGGIIATFNAVQQSGVCSQG